MDNQIIDNPAEEKEIAIDNFKNSLVIFLQAESEEVKNIIADYNLMLLKLLEDQKFKKDLENAIFANQEKLTGKDFVLEGKRQMPTIANWLKDFIKKNGSGAVDNLALSQYVAASENAKKLDNNEKKLLHKLLLLYRNLKIFPQNLEKVPEDEWEIFPLADDEKPVRKNIKIGGEDERVVELRNLLEQYEPGSIERRAIEEELRKLA